MTTKIEELFNIGQDLITCDEEKIKNYIFRYLDVPVNNLIAQDLVRVNRKYDDCYSNLQALYQNDIWNNNPNPQRALVLGSSWAGVDIILNLINKINFPLNNDEQYWLDDYRLKLPLSWQQLKNSYGLIPLSWWYQNQDQIAAENDLESEEDVIAWLANSYPLSHREYTRRWLWFNYAYPQADFRVNLIMVFLQSQGLLFNQQFNFISNQLYNIDDYENRELMWQKIIRCNPDTFWRDIASSIIGLSFNLKNNGQFFQILIDLYYLNLAIGLPRFKGLFKYNN